MGQVAAAGRWTVGRPWSGRSAAYVGVFAATVALVLAPLLMLVLSAMWGADYPHTQGAWSQLDALMEEMFPDADLALRQEVVWHRAARIFKLGPPPSPAGAVGSRS